MGITQADVINGLVSAGIDKFSSIVLHFLVDKVAESESDQSPEYIKEFKALTRDFFSNEELGKAALKLSMGAILDGVIAVRKDVGEIEWVEKVRSECYVSGMADAMTFTGNHLIDIAKTLIPTLLKLNMKDEARVLKTVVEEKRAEEKEFDVASL
jgi:hypothetical protein